MKDINHIIDYIKALTNLYGIVHKDKVIEIYNMRNDEQLDSKKMNRLISEAKDFIAARFIGVKGDYFVTDALVDNDLNVEVSKRKGKPFYIPETEELLKHTDEGYFEDTKYVRALYRYGAKNFGQEDDILIEEVCDEILFNCKFGTAPGDILEVFNRNGIDFENEELIHEAVEIIINVFNNSRMWDNNGLTPNELSEKKRVQDVYEASLVDDSFLAVNHRKVNLKVIDGGLSKKDNKKKS